jgi:hypothetical protein
VPKPDLPENPRFQVIDSLKVDDYRQINVLFDTRNGGNLVKLSVVGSDTFIAQLFNSDGTPVVSKTADQAHHISFEICQETGGWNNIILKDSANGVEYIWLEKQFQLLQLPSMNGI